MSSSPKSHSIERPLWNETMDLIRAFQWFSVEAHLGPKAEGEGKAGS